MNKPIIIGIIIVVVIVIIYFVYSHMSSSANATGTATSMGVSTAASTDVLIGTYRDPTNPNTLKVIKDPSDGNYYIVEVNGVRHLMVINGSNLTVPDWGSVVTPWSATAIGPMQKISG